MNTVALVGVVVVDIVAVVTKGFAVVVVVVTVAVGGIFLSVVVFFGVLVVVVVVVIDSIDGRYSVRMSIVSATIIGRGLTLPVSGVDPIGRKSISKINS